MSLFLKGDEVRLDWSILRDGSISLYKNRKYLGEDIEWLRTNSYRVYKFDCTRWVSEDELHADFARTLSFPEYYGMNFDALNDCMQEDLALPNEGGVALILDAFDTYCKHFGNDRDCRRQTTAEVILTILARASQFHMLFGNRLLTLVHSSDPQVKFDGLACVHAQWNRREWLNKNRGL